MACHTPHRSAARFLRTFIHGAAMPGVFAAVLLTWNVPAGAQELKPFVLPWDDQSAGPADVSFLSGPDRAGAAGFIRAGDDGHFYAGDKRIRFLGVNFCFAADFPEHAAAQAIAGRLAKFGVNAVRFHHMDSGRFPGGIMKAGGKTSRELDPQALDRLDYFVDQLARHGIYSDLNLLVSRQFVAADGLPAEIEQLGGKDRHVVAMFDPRMIDLQKEYARNLLAHQNPYTRKTLADDAAVAFVEINNENGLIHAWLGGVLDKLPGPFAMDLRRQWNAFLAGKYPTTAKLRTAWGARKEDLGKEMLPDVSAPAPAGGGRDPWSLEQHENAKANQSIDDKADGGKPARKVQVTAAGAQGWHVQLGHPGLTVEKGGLYTLRFRAKADAKSRVVVVVGQAHDPWQALGLTGEVALDTQWQTFTLTLLATDADANGRVVFSGLAARAGAYWFSEVSLRPGGVVGLDEKETLEEGTVPLVAHASLRTWPDAARQDWLAFLYGLEGAYWNQMAAYVKKDLGFKGVVFGTIVSCSTPLLQAQLDAVDSHAYWQHPQFPHRPWDPVDWKVTNKSMVNEAGGVLPRLAMQRVAGKPHLVTEYNHPAPNTYASEAPLLAAAFAGFQDWDALFLFAYSHSAQWDSRHVTSFFDIDQDPAKMANLAVAAALFRRGDLSPSRQPVRLTLSPEKELDAARTTGHAWGPLDMGSLGVPPEAALVHGLMLRREAALTPGLAPKPTLPDTDLTTLAPLKGLRRFESDTGELVWDLTRPGKGVVTVNTPRTRAVVGFSDGRTFDLGGIIVRPGQTRQDWCTLALTLTAGETLVGPNSEGGASGGGGGKALLAATGYGENTKMGWKDAAKSTVGRDWGQAPSLIEVVPATIELPLPAARVSVWALDEKGQRGAKLAVQDTAGRAVFTIGGEQGTLWYEVEWRSAEGK